MKCQPKVKFQVGSNYFLSGSDSTELTLAIESEKKVRSDSEYSISAAFFPILENRLRDRSGESSESTTGRIECFQRGFLAWQR